MNDQYMTEFKKFLHCISPVHNVYLSWQIEVSFAMIPLPLLVNRDSLAQ